MVSPGTAALVLLAFLVGRTVMPLAIATAGAHLLREGTTDVRWRRLDLLVGALLMAAAMFYIWRVLNGDVTSILPGEPGGTLP